MIAGTVVAVAGVYSYRTGDLRPAVAAAAAVGSLTAVGVVGGLVETSGGPLAPVPVWLAAGSAAFLVSLTLPYAFVDRPRSAELHDSDRG